MDTEILNYQFSVFGNFESFYNNIAEYLNDFEGFDKETTQDVFQNGVFKTCYILKNNEVRIAIHFFRIDFIFNEFACDNTGKFNIYFDRIYKFICSNSQTSLVNRLAINYRFFYKDEDGNLLNKISSPTKFLPSNGISEFLIRRNDPFFDSETQTKFNDVIEIQSAILQDKNSFSTIKALTILCDINTVIPTSEDVNFERNDIFKIFPIMFEHLNNKLSAIKNSIEKGE